MERDYAFEALAEVTGTDWNTGRGELNKALALIREESGIEDSYLLADEIHMRAKSYRALMPEVMLTPNALAKHWTRVKVEAKRPSGGTNLHSNRECTTCGGDRFVLVSMRPPVTSAWMREHGIEASKTDLHEEYAPCPDCGPEVVGTPDRAKTRELMSR